MLVVLLTISMFSQGLSMENRGTQFITAFPENVAYYYRKIQNYLNITSLHPDTNVKIDYVGEVNGNISTTMSFSNAGVTRTWNLTKEVEESRFTPSNKSIVISSTKDITVLSRSGYPGRFQSHVVQPVQNLGTVYHIPTLNYTELLVSFNLSEDLELRYRSFRLLVINAVNSTNIITIKQGNGEGQSSVYTQTLDPHHLYQLASNGTVTEISGKDKIAVMLTHPCFKTVNCSCNMVMNQLRPPKLNSGPDRFPIPFKFPSDITQLFLTTNQSIKVANGTLESGNGVEVMNSADILPLLPDFNNGTQLISTSQQVSLRLVIPGLVLDLIPESMFSGCYLVHFSTYRGLAIVIAETASTSSVKMNSRNLPSATRWRIMNGSQFSWAAVLAQSPSIFWHPESKIAVYMTETLESKNIYVSPAIILSKEPDPNGCTVTPGIFHVGNDELSWPMARRYCMDNYDHFARILRKQNQDRMAVNISLPEPIDGWISLRRDILTTQWYWRNEDNASSSVTVTYWDDGEPNVPERGLCASVSLDPAQNFTWKSAPCCSKKKPVCYDNPIYLTNFT